jgi:pilus assembly protein CpaB
MKPKSVILIIIALGCGLVASIGISQVMQGGGQAEQVQGPSTIDVFVTTEPVSIGDELTQELFRLEPWPADKVPPGALTDIEDLEGRRARQRLYAGEPIIEDKLISGAGGSGPSELIPPGYRVSRVPMSSGQIGGLLQAGDHVDVLVYLRKSAEIKRTRTKTILRNVKVFAVDNKIDRVEDGESSTANASSVSLLVKPEQDALLVLAQKLGDVSLSMRRGTDESGTDTDREADINQLLGEDDKVEEEDRGTGLVTADKPTENKEEGGFLPFLQNAGRAAAAAVQTMPVQPQGEHTMTLMGPGGVEQWAFAADGSLPRQLHAVGTPVTGGSMHVPPQLPTTPPPAVDVTDDGTLIDDDEEPTEDGDYSDPTDQLEDGADFDGFSQTRVSR